MYFILVALLACLLAAPASAQVQVNLGFSFPAPPQLVVVPEVQAVQYVPTASANVFFYGGQYWAFANGNWYSSGGYNGPWVFVAPEYIPQPLLIVPVTYYHRRPSNWRGWHPGLPPQWANNYGHSWNGRHEEFIAPHGAQPAHYPPAHYEEPMKQPPHAQPMHEEPQARPPPQQHPPPHEAQHGEEHNEERR